MSSALGIAGVRVGHLDMFVWTIALAVRLGSEEFSGLSYLIVAAYALLGRAQVIHALMLSWLFTMLNPGLAPNPDAATVGRYAVLFAAAVSVVLHSDIKGLRLRVFTVATILLGAFFIIHAVFFSPIIVVSVLKALSWTIAMVTIIAAWSGMTEAERLNVSRQVFIILAAILIISLPLALTTVGYLRNGTGFQGILNHPQAFGVTIALLGAWTIARLLGERRPRLSLMALALASGAAVLMSESRTAGLGMVLGIAVAVPLTSAFAGRSILKTAPGLGNAVNLALITGSLALCLLFVGEIVALIQEFISKSSRTNVGTLLEAYYRSRGVVIEPMLYNISEQPLTGIGFGIASSPSLMVVNRDPFFGLPVSASVEKGVMPLAVVEEVGVPGAILVLLWLFALFRSSSRGGLPAFTVCATVIALNFGEAVFFSPGGMGLLSLILVGWAYASGMSASNNHG